MEKRQISVEEFMDNVKYHIQLIKEQVSRNYHLYNNSIHLLNKNEPKKLVFVNYKQGNNKNIIKFKKLYHINELLIYHDIEFIDNAYRAILKREPDIEGRNYFLELLRSGKASKIEIIGKIRYSQEGRQKGIKISGLLSRLIVKHIEKLPIIGNSISTILTLIKLHKIIKQLEMSDIQIYNKLTQNSEINRLILDNVNRILNLVDYKVDNLDKKNQLIIQEVEKLRKQINYIKLDNIELYKNINLLFKKYSDKDKIEQNNTIKQIGQSKDSTPFRSYNNFYFYLENHFRGSSDILKQRLEKYLPYIKNIALEQKGKILDIGCGKGDWLELLSKHNIEGIGIDNNTSFVDFCRKRGLSVKYSDALDYLNQQANNTFSAITGFHIIEHLTLDKMIQLLEECLRTLKPGGLIIFETPNPENILVGSCYFYIDPTHNKPIPWETFRYIVESIGYTDIKILKLNPFPEFYKLNQDIKENHQLFKLFQYFYGPRDYAIIGYKPWIQKN